MTFLATTAGVTPFIGLFGTVVGIMIAFQRIGASGSTNLAIVAPGISEALVATAAGLFAAIPALVFYNHFTHRVKDLSAAMDDFALEFFEYSGAQLHVESTDRCPKLCPPRQALVAVAGAVASLRPRCRKSTSFRWST